MTRAIDAVYALKFIRTLTQKWEQTTAFKSGAMDAHGNFLDADKQTPAQKASYTKFDVLVFNIKKMLEKIPFGKTTLARYAVALKLLKEHVGDRSEALDEAFYQYIQDNNLCEDNVTGGIDMSSARLKAPTSETPDEEFGGNPVFHVDTNSFLKSKDGKRKYARFKTYVGADETGSKIRGYANKNPNKTIMLKDKSTGEFLYFRRK